MARKKIQKKSSTTLKRKKGISRKQDSQLSIERAAEVAETRWSKHTYRPFVEVLPLVLSVLTILTFLIVLLDNFLLAVVATTILVVLFALLFDLLDVLHLHFSISSSKKIFFENVFTGHGRGLLTVFFVCFLFLFSLFAFSAQEPTSTLFVAGDVFTIIMFFLSCFLILSYVVSIVFLGFKRIRFQLSLASLLLFSYLFLFFAFAVRRFAL